ncbi:unnamed protein product [Vitrella brassicaformis CCMP3155]|uniref:Uncharacterized protein n=1 Tax=Vitrella brassicaformis (strain CCMP3155) TaxID=1169540 RepID=A0A0G4EAP8_VITBC|nr:unnamed protein product [Vitrella brassicaformis CCMP3155]|mmetsp:Transcript_27008/g.67281  ORF Transcript_27008/g.67281 Transcript_27008/m.67281 type:complete len:509 (-) Transcript_27008:1367-2893(-)|eukprot:CEL92348.1 unnamed protein product [Vitrella brassicaformis CCMP3155]
MEASGGVRKFPRPGTPHGDILSKSLSRRSLRAPLASLKCSQSRQEQNYTTLRPPLTERENLGLFARNTASVGPKGTVTARRCIPSKSTATLPANRLKLRPPVTLEQGEAVMSPFPPTIQFGSRTPRGEELPVAPLLTRQPMDDKVESMQIGTMRFADSIGQTNMMASAYLPQVFYRTEHSEANTLRERSVGPLLKGVYTHSNFDYRGRAGVGMTDYDDRMGVNFRNQTVSPNSHEYSDYDKGLRVYTPKVVSPREKLLPPPYTRPYTTQPLYRGGYDEISRAEAPLAGASTGRYYGYSGGRGIDAYQTGTAADASVGFVERPAVGVPFPLPMREGQAIAVGELYGPPDRLVWGGPSESSRVSMPFGSVANRPGAHMLPAGVTWTRREGVWRPTPSQKGARVAPTSAQGYLDDVVQATRRTYYGTPAVPDTSGLVAPTPIDPPNPTYRLRGVPETTRRIRKFASLARFPPPPHGGANLGTLICGEDLPDDLFGPRQQRRQYPDTRPFHL